MTENWPTVTVRRDDIENLLDWWSAGDVPDQDTIDRLHEALKTEPAPPAELTEARCPSCDHLTEGHTAAGCWYVVDDHSPSVDGICQCTRVHKPADTPEDPR